MKKSTLLFLSMGFISMPLFAQQSSVKHQGNHSRDNCVSVVDAAKNKTTEMAAKLQLSDEQSRKIYKIFLEQGKKDSITTDEIKKLREIQQSQHSAQDAAIRKILNEKQLTALNLIPLMAVDNNDDCGVSQCCPQNKMKQKDAYKAMKERQHNNDKSSKQKKK